METSVEFQTVRVKKSASGSVLGDAIQNEPSVEIKFGDSDFVTLHKALEMPIDFQLKGISVEIPLFSSKDEVNNFCISSILLVETYESLKYISVCTNNSGTAEEDLVENYRNDMFSQLNQAIFKLNPYVIFTDCLNCSNDIQTRRFWLLGMDGLKISRLNVSFSHLKYKRRIANVFPRYGRFVHWIS